MPAHRFQGQKIMTQLAIDIGGANLKAADGLGYAASLPLSTLAAARTAGCCAV